MTVKGYRQPMVTKGYDQVMADQLMGLSEVAELLGVSRQRADQLARTVGFPPPIATLVGGRIWDGEAVEQWARETGRIQ
jgi:predicted DNA-binding transcriptional regulator AlpA